MQTTRTVLIILFASISLSSCATQQATWISVHKDWNPPQGGDYAVAQCLAKAEAVYVPNPYEKPFKERDIYNKCMEAYGYKLTALPPVQTRPSTASPKQ
jgi:hypothetical protein